MIEEEEIKEDPSLEGIPTPPSEDDMIYMDFMADHFVGSCPECHYVNRVSTIADKVVCGGCGHLFLVGDIENQEGKRGDELCLPATPLKVSVTFWRGVIDRVTLPDGVELVIKDYDPESYDEEDLIKDDEGELYHLSEYKGGEDDA